MIPYFDRFAITEIHSNSLPTDTFSRSQMTSISVAQ